MNMIPFVAKHKFPGFYELVVDSLFIDLLLKKFDDFKIIIDYDSSKPIESNTSIHGIRRIKEIVQFNTISNAVKAICNGRRYGPAQCYRNIIKKTGLNIELKGAVLNWDIQVSDFHPPTSIHLLIIFSILILKSLSNSHEICYFSA